MSDLSGETIGSIISKKRKTDGISIEMLTAKTKIAPRTLQSIEKNNFSFSPGDIYTIGFLENICEALNLEKKEIIDLFKKQSQAVKAASVGHGNEVNLHEEVNPNEDEKRVFSAPHNLNGNPVLYIAGLILFLVLCGIALYFYNQGKTKKTVYSPDNQSMDVSVYKMYRESGAYDLRKGDLVDVLYNGIIYKINLIDVFSKKAELSVSGTVYTIEQDRMISVDLDNDGNNDLEIRLKKTSGEISFFHFKILIVNEKDVDYQTIWDSHPHTTAGKECVLFSEYEKQPLVLYVKAVSSASFLQWNTDGLRQNTKTLAIGEFIEIKGDDIIEIGIGNFKHVIFIVNKIPIDLSLDEEQLSITKIVKWIKSPDNETKHNLIIKDYVN